MTHAMVEEAHHVLWEAADLRSPRYLTLKRILEENKNGTYLMNESHSRSETRKLSQHHHEMQTILG